VQTLKVAVDATCWHNRRGYGRHARALLRALVRLDKDAQYTLFVDSAEAAEPLPEECETRLLRASVPTVEAASADGHRTLRDMWRMSRALSGSEFSVVLFPTVYSYVPVMGRARKLVMMHDVIAETFPKLTLPRRSARMFWNAKVALGRLQADALITVSDYSRDCILARFGGDPSRIRVVGEAADPIFRKLEFPAPTQALTRLGLDGTRRLAVYLGGFSPHKNLIALVNAFANVAARPEFSDLLLAMVGDTSSDAFHTYFGEVAAHVKALNLPHRVIFTGFLSDEDVVALLNLSKVLLLPSLMEGFGLPALEAAACGCPVIATKASPLEGLLGGGGIYIEPVEGEIVRALERVLSSEEIRLKMSQEALRAARRLTWESAAQQLREVIHA